MPAYYSLLVPAGLALFAAAVGIAALCWERHKVKQSRRSAGQDKATAYG